MQSGRDNTGVSENTGNFLSLNWDGGLLSVYCFLIMLLDIYVAIHADTYIHLFIVHKKINVTDNTS